MCRRRSIHRLALAWCALATLGGCTMWSKPSGVAPELFQQGRVWEARVTVQDSTATLLLKNPVLTRDSLVGAGAAGRRVAIPVGDVQQLTVRRSDVVRTSVLMVSGLAVAIGAFAWLLEMAYGGASS